MGTEKFRRPKVFGDTHANEMYNILYDIIILYVHDIRPA